MNQKSQRNLHELRWPVLLAVLTVIVLQVTLSEKLAFPYIQIFCLIELVLATGILFSGSSRITEHKNHIWILGVVLNSMMSIINIATLVNLIEQLLNRGFTNPIQILFSGGNIWISNVIIFSLWYWEFDSGGAGRRATNKPEFPDFMFAQLENPHLAPGGWRPHYIDYLYLSLTNASAFSPTDVLPLARWAKLLMALQSITSLFTVVLIIARAINTLQ